MHRLAGLAREDAEKSVSREAVGDGDHQALRNRGRSPYFRVSGGRALIRLDLRAAIGKCGERPRFRGNQLGRTTIFPGFGPSPPATLYAAGFAGALAGFGAGRPPGDVQPAGGA